MHTAKIYNIIYFFGFVERFFRRDSQGLVKDFIEAVSKTFAHPLHLHFAILCVTKNGKTVTQRDAKAFYF